MSFFRGKNMLRKTEQLLDKPVPKSPMKNPSHALV